MNRLEIPCDVQAWHKGLVSLANKALTREETMSLFNKYDEDGGGSIDIFEFIDAMLPRDFPKRTVVSTIPTMILYKNYISTVH